MNSFDIRDSEKQDSLRAEQAKLASKEREKENSLYALVFNSEAGRKLVKIWQEKYVHTWIAEPNATQIGVGIKQGQANFVMDIVKRLEQIEKGVKNG